MCETRFQTPYVCNAAFTRRGASTGSSVERRRVMRCVGTGTLRQHRNVPVTRALRLYMRAFTQNRLRFLRRTAFP